MTTATFESRLLAGGGERRSIRRRSHRRFRPRIAQAPDEKLFRMNPYRYAAETGIGEREAVPLRSSTPRMPASSSSVGVFCALPAGHSSRPTTPFAR